MVESQSLAEPIIHAAEMVATSFARSGRLFIFGNGGSAADAQHLAAEFINRFQIDRPPLPALALTTDTSVLTAVTNDYSFNDVFAKQLKALGRSGDVAWGISTSGRSTNVINALHTARTLGLKTLAMTGASGGELKNLADIVLEVPSTVTPRIQEVHITIGHIICYLVDYVLFQRPGEVIFQ
ncbi:MAG: D-sedoheptulose 7-phosphate isomerase [Deltaproteobacteria bacterium]|nr:D-sedoheptulose 7-phosphate isomerase [Deltaproteobacteria bacterium]